MSDINCPICHGTGEVLPAGPSDAPVEACPQIVEHFKDIRAELAEANGLLEKALSASADHKADAGRLRAVTRGIRREYQAEIAELERQRDKFQADTEKLRARYEEFTIDLLCDVCCGKPLPDGRSCICGGTGSKLQALNNLRVELVQAEQRCEKLERDLAEARGLYLSAIKDAKGTENRMEAENRQLRKALVAMEAVLVGKFGGDWANQCDFTFAEATRKGVPATADHDAAIRAEEMER